VTTPTIMTNSSASSSFASAMSMTQATVPTAETNASSPR
jgi:hypothetical protein